ncbi:unnamed protein product, partial [Mesorhabditis belari]|uniref:C-type lectin domain-containing protein n=1 Tax=Mesorhabditis belari TaxID=2138241 RepID=A0AAF3FJ90_9BILA
MIAFSILSFVLVQLVFAQDSNCPSGFFYQSDLDICLKGSTVPAKWTDALSLCQSTLNADLLSIHNAFQNSLLASIQQNLTGADRGYLGALYFNGNYRWSDDTLFDYQRFEPTNEVGGDVVTLNSNGTWQVAYSSDLLHYLCASPKIGDVTIPAVPTPSTNLSCIDRESQPVGSCKQGWQYSSETGYLYLVLQGLTIHEADTECKSLGAKLISIHSKVENDFVTGLCCETSCRNSAVYLTGGIRQVNGTSTWSDGSSYDYEAYLCVDYLIREASYIFVSNYNDRECKTRFSPECPPGSWSLSPDFFSHITYSALNTI